MPRFSQAKTKLILRVSGAATVGGPSGRACLSPTRGGCLPTPLRENTIRYRKCIITYSAASCLSRDYHLAECSHTTLRTRLMKTMFYGECAPRTPRVCPTARFSDLKTMFYREFILRTPRVCPTSRFSDMKTMFYRGFAP